MDQETTEPEYQMSRLGWAWLGTLVLCVIASWIIGRFNNSTELTPSYDTPLQIGLYTACVVAALSAMLIFFQSHGALYRRLVMSIIVAPIFAFLGVFLLIAEISALAEVEHDFPVGKTKTFEGLIMLQRAYQTHGKGRSWNIQTMPIWSNIDITQSDYNFMLSHRSPDDHGRDPDEVTSNGYFCAHVTLQQSGEALRVMNAGNYKLPSGSVGICSHFMAAFPHQPMIQ